MSEISRLRWRSRRGMKELDIALQGYLDKYYEQAEAAEQETFRSLLEMQDRELFELIIGHTKAEDESVAVVITKIRGSFLGGKSPT